jgi:monoamine oxidase
VLGEVFDAGDPASGAGALGGFIALDAAQRAEFRRGMPLLIESQLAQLFGAPAQQGGRQESLDWADEPWTCADADRAGPPGMPQAGPVLRQPHWAGRLFFGASESAAHGAGHMEGALEAAARIARALAPARIVAAGQASPGDARGQYAACVAALRAEAPAHYRQHLGRLLAGQQGEQLTQRALLATVDQVYSQTLAALDGWLPLLGQDQAGPVLAGRHPLTTDLLSEFAGWNAQLLAAALAFNGGSCALSNFPDEHRPDAALQRVIGLDLASAWREFALELNARLLAVATGTAPLAVPA